MAETIRAFLAVELNDRNKETIRKLQEHLKPLDCGISWVKPENIHLTLKFLGDVKPKMIAPLTGVLAEVCRGIQPIQTQLTELGVFPDIRRPRVLWAGLKDTGGKLTQLATAVEDALGHIGFKKEIRPFHAHITVGRIRTNGKLPVLIRELQSYVLPAAHEEIILSFTLFKSTLTSQGPIYEKLKEFPFQTT